MPINASYEYVNAELEYQKASNNKEKLEALKKMLTTAPKHKGAENLVKQIKRKIADLKEDIQKEKKQSKRGKQTTIKREGAAQLMLIGFPNSGKSTLLSELSKEKVPIAEYEFTTKEPEVRMIPYENVWIQGVEVPAVYEGFYESKIGKQMFGIIRNADLILLVIDGEKNPVDHLQILLKEFKKAGIQLTSKEKGHEEFIEKVPCIIVYTKKMPEPRSTLLELFSEKEGKLKKEIWKTLGKVRVQTRVKGVIAKKPVILEKGSTVEDLAKMVHKDFLRKFRYAKIYGPSAKFEGQQVGLEHELKDTDVVEIFTK